MNYEDNFSLSRKENVFLAKKHFSSVVYTGLKMENRNITFPQTEVILNGVNDGDVALDDIYAILGMKRAMQVLLRKMDSPLDLPLIKEFNYHIAKEEAIESGVIRMGGVSISGTDYIPGDEDEKTADEFLHGILESGESVTEKALDLFTNMIYRQFFWDGNKRTALMTANFLLCQNGKGLIEINDRNMKSFAILLNDFFNTGNGSELKRFVYENCIQGMKITKTNDNLANTPKNSE